MSTKIKPEYTEFGIIVEDLEKLIKASTLMAEMLQILEIKYINDFYVKHHTQYDFISKEMEIDIIKNIKSTIIDATVLQKEFKQHQLTLTLPTITPKENAKLELQCLITDYLNVLYMMNNIFTEKKKFTKSNMTYMNSINNYVSQLHKRLNE